jgi:hypothetical protein
MILAEKQTRRLMESSREVNSHSYCHLILSLVAKTYIGEKTVSNEWCWENWISTCRRRKLDLCLSPHTKINSKWIKDINITPKTLNLLEENMGEAVWDIGLGKYFLKRTPIDQEITIKINEWGCIQLKTLLYSKGNNIVKR